MYYLNYFKNFIDLSINFSIFKPNFSKKLYLFITILITVAKDTAFVISLSEISIYYSFIFFKNSFS